MVIKRTSKRKGSRIVPVDLGTVGEIINGVFIPLQAKNDTKKRVDIKDYAEVADIFKVSWRTLQEYRNDGILPYIEMKGKCVYKESNIEKVLKRNYRRF